MAFQAIWCRYQKRIENCPFQKLASSCITTSRRTPGSRVPARDSNRSPWSPSGRAPRSSPGQSLNGMFLETTLGDNPSLTHAGCADALQTCRVVRDGVRQLTEPTQAVAFGQEISSPAGESVAVVQFSSPQSPSKFVGLSIVIL